MALEEPDGRAVEEETGTPEPDVVLDVPTLKVEKLQLEVEDLRARVSLQAEVADLVRVNVGVDAHIGSAKLGIEGVEAEALLKVRLERVLGTLERALATIEQNPEILGLEARTDGAEAETEAETEAEVSEESAEEPAEEPTGSSGDEVEATEAARRKARELGIGLDGLRGTGAGGRVLVRDVEEAAGG